MTGTNSSILNFYQNFRRSFSMKKQHSDLAQQTNASSKLTIETIEEGVKIYSKLTKETTHRGRML